MKTTVIHHSADMDGLFCREIARKFLPDAELIGWDFKDKSLPIPEYNDGDKLYVMDLPIDGIFGFNYANAEPSNMVTWRVQGGLIWIDHHKTAIDSHPTDIPGYRIDGVAACRLAWQWFANDASKGDHYKPIKEAFISREVPEPLAVRLAGEYDIWDKRDPRAEVFQFGLRSRELTPEAWSLLLDNDEGFVELLLADGSLLQRYQQSSDKGTMHRSFITEFEGLKFLALNTARCNSLTFASKDVPETGHDALMGFYFDGEKWNVSMYHAKHRMDLDLSQIAVKFTFQGKRGGGHKGACGFAVESAEDLPFSV